MEPDEIRAIVKAVEARSGPGVEMLPGTLQEVNDTQGVVLLDGTTQPAGVNVVTECEPGDRVMVLFVPPRGGFVVGRFAVAAPESFRFVEQLRFTTPGMSTFDRSLYPWLRAVKVRCQGGGGGGGGTDAVANRGACASGGGGGSYAKSLLMAESVPSAVTITVGAGGSGGVAGVNAGAAGGASSFGSLVIAEGGVAGFAGSATAFGNATFFTGSGANNTAAGTGDIVVPGSQPGTRHHAGTGGIAMGSRGGDSALGSGGFAPMAFGASTAGNPGRGRGGGGSGAAASGSTVSRTGGAGAAGIVIVDLYA